MRSRCSPASQPARSLFDVFTGIVQERGRVVSFENGRLVVGSSLKPSPGDSVAVDGVCLTAVASKDGTLAFDVVPETLSRTKGFAEEVNLEPALRIGDPLGGHFVQGHVDAVGSVASFDGERLRVEAPPDVLHYCVEKGSIAVDGVALTIAAVDDEGFEVALVPHTLEVTTLGSLSAGDPVNLEVDVLAKYVEKLLGARLSS